MIPNPTPPRTDSTDRTTDEELGIIAAALKGQVEHFEFRGLNVIREEAFNGNAELRVMDEHLLETLGGRYLTTPISDPRTVHTWLSNKARHFGEAVTMEGGR